MSDVVEDLVKMADDLDAAERTGAPLQGGVEGGVWIRLSDELAREMSADLRRIATAVETFY